MVELEPAAGEADLARWASVKNAVVPSDPVSVGELRADRERGALLLLASLGGTVAGCGIAKKSSGRDLAFVSARVLPDHRGRGVGSALYVALSDHARGLGLSRLKTWAVEGDGPAIAFLEHRGFVEVARGCEMRLDLRGAGGAGERPVPDGVEIVCLAGHLDFAPQVHELAVEGYAYIPTGDDISAPAFEEWKRENVNEALVDGSFLAVAGGSVVGSAGLVARPADPGVAEHLLTAVSRAWRRRGIARALKTAQIGWARRAGYRELVTFNDAANGPMRRLNRELGYLPRPVQITFHGPVADPRR